MTPQRRLSPHRHGFPARASLGTSLGTCLALVVVLAAAPALADDAAPGEAAGYETEGSLRVGWRLLRDDDDGRFLQDVGLTDGPRIYDFHLLASRADGDAVFDEVEATASGVGDRSTDYLVTLRGADGLRLEGGHRRDLYHYYATGDPYQYDTTRERTYVRGRWAPDRNLSVRFGWDRSRRRGKAFTSADTDARARPPPAGVDVDLVSDRRPLDQRFDTFELGVDASTGIWRFGVTESVRVGHVNDERFYDIPPARRGADPVREALDRDARSTSFTTVAKIGATLLDDALDATLFVTHTRLPLETEVAGRTVGVDDQLSGGTPRGAFASRLDGDTDVDRRAQGWRLESEWRALDDLEIVAAIGQDDTVDDGELRLAERRSYARPDVPDELRRRSFDARVTDRTDRASIEGAWDATDDVRLRLGHEWYTQDLKVPTDSRRGTLTGTLVRSRTTRWVGGVDVEPMEGLEVSALVRHADNDDPHAQPGPEQADDVKLRTRWKASEDLTVSSVYRRRTLSNDELRGSRSRTQSAAVTGSWTSGALSVDGSVTWQEFDTRTDTAFFVVEGVFTRRRGGTVRFRTRDRVGTLFAHYELGPGVRLSAGCTYVDSRGDFGVRTHDVSVGGEYDLRSDLTLGATLRAWRYDERERHVDDYTSEGLELFLEYRF